MTKISIIIFTVLHILSAVIAHQLNVGKLVSSVKIQNPDNVPTMIPSIGQKAVAIFYTDPDIKDVNEPITEAIKAKHFPLDKFVGIGIANCADSWLPNSAIRYASRQKQAKYPTSVIVCDNEHILSRAWDLGNCNGLGYVIIIGKDSKVRYAKAIKTPEESKAIINSVIGIIEKELL